MPSILPDEFRRRQLDQSAAEFARRFGGCYIRIRGKFVNVNSLELRRYAVRGIIDDCWHKRPLLYREGSSLPLAAENVNLGNAGRLRVKVCR
jgi:hypothetical protein